MIVDEASQADLNALIPLYMARQVVIVGDHEQVTPLGVGKEQVVLENLRKTMLHEFPNAHLFDAMSSIYDIGRQAFGDAVRLDGAFPLGAGDHRASATGCPMKARFCRCERRARRR